MYSMGSWSRTWMAMLAVALAAGSAWAQGRPSGDPGADPKQGQQPPGQPDTSGVAPRSVPGPETAAEDAAGEHVRRREDITYRPTIEERQDFDCRLIGSMEALILGKESLNAKATILSKATAQNADGTVRVAYKIVDGLCDIGGKQKTVGKKDTILYADFDPRHQMLKVENANSTEVPEDGKKDKLDLGTILLYVCTSVAFHERSMGEGTHWSAEYQTIDANGRKLRMSGEHDLVEFLPDGDRRVAVIHSVLTIPVMGKAGSFDVAGKLDCDVLSEVYVDTGELRYRRAVCSGTLHSLVALDIPRLEAWVRLLRDGQPVASLHEPDALPQLPPPEVRPEPEEGQG